MKRLLWFMGCAVAFALIVPSAGASTFVNDPWSGSGEQNIYQIYNSIYGTTYSSTTGAGAIVGSDGTPLPADMGGMTGIQIAETGWWTIPSPAGASFVVEYAGNNNTMGYYTFNDGVNGSNASLSLTQLFNADGSVTNGATADIPEPFGTPVEGGGLDFGLYISTDGSASNTPPTTYYSQDIRNLPVGQDQVVVYQAMGLDDAGNWAAIEGEYLIAFEDLLVDLNGPGGDEDYNDFVIRAFFPTGTTTNEPVPEPATIALMLMGLGGVAMRRRFKA